MYTCTTAKSYRSHTQECEWFAALRARQGAQGPGHGTGMQLTGGDQEGGAHLALAVRNHPQWNGVVRTRTQMACVAVAMEIRGTPV